MYVPNTRKVDMRPWLLIDYDDTLGGVLIDGKVESNHAAYHNAIEDYKNTMATWGFDPEKSEVVRDRIDRELLEAHGFADKHRFAEAMWLAFMEMRQDTGRVVRGSELQIIKRIGLSVFEYRYMPLPGALDTLQKLQKSYRIAVVTKGNYTEQNIKVKESGVYYFVDDVFVMDYKNLDEWKYLFKHLHINGPILEDSWAIGNAIRSDINNPLKLGANAIHIKVPGDWDFELEAFETPKDLAQLYSVSNISEILHYIN
jgi:FMN phosphatase YigB (HAD superfamily)